MIELCSFKIEINMCDQKPMHHVAKSQRAIVMNFANSFWHQIKFQFNFLVHITFRNNFCRFSVINALFSINNVENTQTIFLVYIFASSHYDLIDFH